jgi:hypothetical protein
MDMLTAILSNGKIIHANEYIGQRHGFTLLCIDAKCRAPVIHVAQSERAAAHFKTVGRGDNEARHKDTCGFYEPLDFIGAVEKTHEYHKAVLENENVPKQIVTLSLKLLDPDYVTKEGEKNEKKKQESDKVKLKDDKESPGVITSLKNVVKLLTSYEPDVLATLYFNIGGGRKLPMSHVVLSPIRAYETLWEDRTIRGLHYFVYGKIQDVRKLEKVMYIDLIKENDHPFTIVVFADYYKHFKYEPSEIINKDVLIYGELRKNEYNGAKKTEIIIKTSKYLEFIRRKEKKL